jgi:hypothetical protein
VVEVEVSEVIRSGDDDGDEDNKVEVCKAEGAESVGVVEG